MASGENLRAKLAIRHQMSLNIAAGLGLGGNESYPGLFQPFGGFADGIPVEDSYVRLPDIPGIGFEAKHDLFHVMKQLAEQRWRVERYSHQPRLKKN